MSRRAPTPAHLALRILAGYALVTASVLLLGLFPAPNLIAYRLPLIALSVLGIILGYAVALLALSRLTQGIENTEWSNDELAQLQNKAQWPIWTPLTFLLIVASMGFMFLGRHGHHRMIVWVLLIPSQAISQLRYALRRPRKPGPGHSNLRWNDLHPLQSDHWGNPPIHEPK